MVFEASIGFLIGKTRVRVRSCGVDKARIGHISIIMTPSVILVYDNYDC